MLSQPEITRILATLSDGDRSAAAELLPLVYGELRALAGGYMGAERAGHTLQATALVHEAYLRLVDGDSTKWKDRGHFYRLAAVTMRHILVNHARDKARIKRGGGRERLPLDDALAVFEESATDLIALDEALSKLADLDRRKARVVELRFFAGMGMKEVAETLAVSVRTVKNDWSFSRLWLLREIGQSDVLQPDVVGG